MRKESTPIKPLPVRLKQCYDESTFSNCRRFSDLKRSYNPINRSKTAPLHKAQNGTFQDSKAMKFRCSYRNRLNLNELAD